MTGDAAVVEDDRRRAGDRAGQRRRAVVADRAGRARGLVRRARRRGRRSGTAGAASRRPAMAGGATAPQRCSRATVELRHPPSAAARYGQMPLSGRSGGESPGAGGAGRVPGSTAVMRRRIAGLAADRPARRRAGDHGARRTQKSRRRPIFPKGCPLSIFGAGELNFRVRDGNGCGLSARVTGIFRVWMVSAAARRTVAMTVRGAGMDLRSSSSQVDLITILQPPTPGQLLKRSSPRPLVPLSFIRHRTSTCGLSNRWSPCGLTRLTRWGTSSRGELRT